jgi:hypothetical protein
VDRDVLDLGQANDVKTPFLQALDDINETNCLVKTALYNTDQLCLICHIPPFPVCLMCVRLQELGFVGNAGTQPRYPIIELILHICIKFLQAFDVWGRHSN